MDKYDSSNIVPTAVLADVVLESKDSHLSLIWLLSRAGVTVCIAGQGYSAVRQGKP